MNEKKLSRRSFLKGALATAAMTGAASVGLAETAAIYTPGTYMASAPGFGGEVVVTITVDETAILSANCRR